jgi:hypothetical protein
VVPHCFAVLAIFFLDFLLEELKIEFIREDFPEFDLPTNKNYFFLTKIILSSSNCCSKNLGSVV